MQKFITRVELHRAELADYELLHISMTGYMFHRTVTSEDNRTYSLPTGMYYSQGDLSAAQVRELAQAAAQGTGRTYWIFTAEYTNAAWILHEITK